MATWEEMLWAELDALPDTDQLISTGELITHINQDILPALGDRRRDKVVELLEKPQWDATKLAESIGARRGTILRLAQEGRTRQREQA